MARVSAWRYEGEQFLRCLDLYELPDNRHSHGAELSAATAPAYFEAMAETEVVAADDARRDPRTCGFTAEYLVPLGITSMLDARIHFSGTLHGVLCAEHIGPAREWTPEDESFVLAAANLVSVALEYHHRRQAEEALVTQTEILRSVTQSLAAYVEREDWKDAFSHLLRCALALTGSEYGFVGVVVEGPELRVLAHEGIAWDSLLNREFYEQALRQYEELGYLTFRSFANLFGEAITSEQVVIANDPGRDPRAGGRPAGHPPMHSFMGVPIRGRDQVTGVIALANRAGGYGSEERRRIETLVQHVGGLCESYRQRERARAQDEERRRTEAALRASDERLRMVARATNDAVRDWDMLTNAIIVPEGFQKLFGDEDEPPDMTLDYWFGRVHPDDRVRIAASLRSLVDGGAQVWTAEYRFRRADGAYATVFDRGYVLRDEHGRPVRLIAAMMDVSERKALEAQLRQSQKLEAVGQLAGGVAHDFNNLLTVIQGHASLCLTEERLTEEASNSIRKIVEATERAAGLTRQLLAFSRKQVLETTDLDLREVVERMVRLLERILGEDVALDIQPSAAPAFVHADASMMEQVILNLAVNARDAMHGGGRLTLVTTVERIEAAAVPEHADARAGLFVHLRMTDSGCGIPPEVLPHISEPFFTTKGIEKGTGLGLATVYGIVKQHRGWVTVVSEAGRGTTFDVFLPAIPERATALPARETKTVARAGGGGETILIVEDEAPVRQLARLILERAGYAVLEADNGPAALAVWRQHQGRVALVVTDMVMPAGLSGLDLAAELLRSQPDLRVIVTSGYSVDLSGQQVARTDRQTFLAKPYALHQLLDAVRASLDTL